MVCLTPSPQLYPALKLSDEVSLYPSAVLEKPFQALNLCQSWNKAYHVIRSEAIRKMIAFLSYLFSCEVKHCIFIKQEVSIEYSRNPYDQYFQARFVWKCLYKGQCHNVHLEHPASFMANCKSLVPVHLDFVVMNS